MNALKKLLTTTLKLVIFVGLLGGGYYAYQAYTVEAFADLSFKGEVMKIEPQAGVAADQLSTSFGWTMVIPPDAVVMSFGFAALIGIVFYPAVRASRLDPIEALRYE